MSVDDSRKLPLYPWDDLEWMDDIELQSDLLELLRRHCNDIAIAICAGKDVSPAVAEFRALVEVCQNAAFDPARMAALSPQQRRATMKRKQTLLHELRSLLGRVQEALLLTTATTTSDDQARWLSNVDSLKFGLRALRYAQRLSLPALQKELAALAERASPLGDLVAHPTDLVSVSSRLTTHG